MTRRTATKPPTAPPMICFLCCFSYGTWCFEFAVACGFAGVGRVVVIVGIVTWIDIVIRGEGTILVTVIMVVCSEVGIVFVYVPVIMRTALCAVDTLPPLETEASYGEAEKGVAGGAEVDGPVDVVAET